MVAYQFYCTFKLTVLYDIKLLLTVLSPACKEWVVYRSKQTNKWWMGEKEGEKGEGYQGCQKEGNKK